jgi:cytoplasmic iron level regulating protein YaaA (DUF328/UPF0246 family)
MASPLVLIPPSEGKAPGGRAAPWHSGERRTASLDDARRIVIAALADAMHGDLAARTKLLGVGADASERATRANLDVPTGPTLPAIERYDGVLYGALDHRTLTPTQRRRLHAQVLIFSGLWGAVAPDDPIPDYKCKMGAALAPLGKLSTWWRPRLAPLLHERSARRVVWDLLPNEHDAACTLSPQATLVVRVRFLDDVERNGVRSLVTVNHWNKLLKGSLVRHVLATQLTDPDGLAAFTHPEGYVYRPELTEANGRTVDVALVARR